MAKPGKIPPKRVVVSCEDADGAASLPVASAEVRGAFVVPTFSGLIWLKFPFASTVGKGLGVGVAVCSRVADEGKFAMLTRFFDILWKREPLLSRGDCAFGETFPSNPWWEANRFMR
jgi:hypothetical protein